MPTQDEILELQQMIGSAPLNYQQRLIALNALKQIAPVPAVSAIPSPLSVIPDNAVNRRVSVNDKGRVSTSYGIPDPEEVAEKSEKRPYDRLKRYQQTADLLAGSYMIPEYKAGEKDDEGNYPIVYKGTRPATAADILASSAPNSEGVIYGPSDTRGTRINPEVYQRIIDNSVMARGGVKGSPAVTPYLRNLDAQNPFSEGAITPEGQYQLTPGPVDIPISQLPGQLPAAVIPENPGFLQSARDAVIPALTTAGEVLASPVRTVRDALGFGEKTLKPIDSSAVLDAVQATGSKDREKVAEWLKQNGYEVP